MQFIPNSPIPPSGIISIAFVTFASYSYTRAELLIGGENL
jgi:hypothetical protein